MTDQLRQAAQAVIKAWDNDGSTQTMEDLRTALEQQAEPPPEWPLIKNILAEYGLQAISFVAEWKAAQQQAEPVAFYDFTKGFRWAKPTSIFAPTIVDVPPMPLYTTPPQRTWVGLTDGDWGWVADKKETSLDTFAHGAAWAADQLKERNNG